MECWLHRRGKATWHFRPSQMYGEVVRVSKSGEVYAVLADHKLGKPFWIGHLVTGADGSRSWVTV